MAELTANNSTPQTDQHAHRLTRRPHAITCRRCTQPNLTGLDADTCALTVHLEPMALTPAGEVWALQHNRPTYQLHPIWGITPRDRWNTPGNPPSQTTVIVTTHKCAEPIPTDYRLHLPPRAHTQTTQSEHPPF